MFPSTLYILCACVRACVRVRVRVCVCVCVCTRQLQQQNKTTKQNETKHSTLNFKSDVEHDVLRAVASVQGKGDEMLAFCQWWRHRQQAARPLLPTVDTGGTGVLGSQAFRGCHGYRAVTAVALAIADHDWVGRGESGDGKTEIHKGVK